MKEWMKILWQHYLRMQALYSGDPLIILFDIDGTILDMRYTIYNVLKRFDRDQGTRHFRDIGIDDIDFHEENVVGFLDRLRLSREHQKEVLQFYGPLFYSIASDPRAQAPFNGVFDIIRWFQGNRGTWVGLNTGRPEVLRKETLDSLNNLGADRGVSFSDDLLFMKPGSWQGSIASLKAEGVRHFQEAGYRVCAFVDNEPENLKAVDEMDDSGEILLLHADTIFKSSFSVMPGHAIGGNVYDISVLTNARPYTAIFRDDDEFLKRTA